MRSRSRAVAAIKKNGGPVWYLLAKDEGDDVQDFGFSGVFRWEGVRVGVAVFCGAGVSRGFEPFGSRSFALPANAERDCRVGCGASPEAGAGARAAAFAFSVAPQSTPADGNMVSVPFTHILNFTGFPSRFGRSMDPMRSPAVVTRTYGQTFSFDFRAWTWSRTPDKARAIAIMFRRPVS